MVEQHYTSQEKGHEKPLPAEADFAAALRRADVCDGYPSEQPAKHIKSLRDFGEFLLDSTVVRSFRAQLAPGYLNLSFLLLFWVFVSASVLGLALEDVFHVLVYGGYESRAGFVWGPFSPIYGVGAVALTLFLNRFYYTHDLVIFLLPWWLALPLSMAPVG